MEVKAREFKLAWQILVLHLLTNSPTSKRLEICCTHFPDIQPLLTQLFSAPQANNLISQLILEMEIRMGRREIFKQVAVL